MPDWTVKLIDQIQHLKQSVWMTIDQDWVWIGLKICGVLLIWYILGFSMGYLIERVSSRVKKFLIICAVITIFGVLAVYFGTMIKPFVRGNGFVRAIWNGDGLDALEPLAILALLLFPLMFGAEEERKRKWGIAQAERSDRQQHCKHEYTFLGYESAGSDQGEHMAAHYKCYKCDKDQYGKT